MSADGRTTVGALRRRIGGQLKAAGANAPLEARLLVAHAIGREAAIVPLVDDMEVDAGQAAVAVDFAIRRLAGEPVARIVGAKEFWGREFRLSAETLVPRPDTETVVEAALAFVDRGAGRQASVRIVDLGTGSGAILLALLSELPNAVGVGVDRSERAAGIARLNAERLGLAERAHFFAGDWSAALGIRFDAVVSNPPYVESDAIGDLPVDVGRYDPHMALDGGSDGLDAYREILADLDRLLVPGGRAFLEIGAGQRWKLAELAENYGFDASFQTDLAGIDRVALLGRPESARRGRGRCGDALENVLGNRVRTG